MPDLDVRAFEASVFSNGVGYHAARVREEHASKRPCVGYKTMLPPTASSTEVTGEAHLRNFMTRFHGGFRFGTKPLTLGDFQLGFMDVASQIVASNIVGSNWAVQGARLSRQYKWKIERAANLGLGEGPRRFGKSVSIAALVVNYCLEVPGAIVSVFTTSKRTSQLLKKKVLQMLVESGFGKYILRYGEEVVIIRHPDRPWERPAIMSFYPSNPRIRASRIAVCHLVLTFICCMFFCVCTQTLPSLPLTLATQVGPFSRRSRLRRRCVRRCSRPRRARLASILSRERKPLQLRCVLVSLFLGELLQRERRLHGRKHGCPLVAYRPQLLAEHGVTRLGRIPDPLAERRVRAEHREPRGLPGRRDVRTLLDVRLFPVRGLENKDVFGLRPL